MKADCSGASLKVMNRLILRSTVFTSMPFSISSGSIFSSNRMQKISLLPCSRNFGSKEHTIDPSKPLRPWLYTVARNLCFQSFEIITTENSEEAEALRILHAGEENDFAAHEFMEELMREIESHAERTSPQTANIFSMAFLEGRSNHEIAAILQINEHTVRNQKARL